MLTGLGCWLLATVALLVVAFLDRLLLDSEQTPYGVFFVLVSVCASVWVRPYDLIAAPVALPIAFALGALPIERGPDGFGGTVMGIFTVLALDAPWLYAGTLICALVALFRKAMLIAQRRASRPVSPLPSGPVGRGKGHRPREVAPQPDRHGRPSPHPQSPHCSEAGPARSRP